jgi:hypothetical protein
MDLKVSNKRTLSYFKCIKIFKHSSQITYFCGLDMKCFKGLDRSL